MIITFNYSCDRFDCTERHEKSDIEQSEFLSAITLDRPGFRHAGIRWMLQRRYRGEQKSRRLLSRNRIRTN